MEALALDVDLFAEFAAELGCLEVPYAFASTTLASVFRARRS